MNWNELTYRQTIGAYVCRFLWVLETFIYANHFLSIMIIVIKIFKRCQISLFLFMHVKYLGYIIHFCKCNVNLWPRYWSNFSWILFLHILNISTLYSKFVFIPIFFFQFWSIYINYKKNIINVTINKHKTVNKFFAVIMNHINLLNKSN